MSAKDNADRLKLILDGFDAALLQTDDADMDDSLEARAIIARALRAYRGGINGRRTLGRWPRARGEAASVTGPLRRRAQPYQDVRASFSMGEDDGTDDAPDPFDLD